VKTYSTWHTLDDNEYHLSLGTDEPRYADGTPQLFHPIRVDQFEAESFRDASKHFDKFVKDKRKGVVT
jgi:hypothetical protein